MHITTLSIENTEAATQLILKLWPEADYEEEKQNCLRILDVDNEVIFLAENEAAHFIGFIYLSLRTDYVEGTETSPVAYIEGIYVEPNFRKHGIAAKLVEKGAEWGKSRGAREYASDVELPNRNSQVFHEKVGFKEVNRVVCYVKKID